MYDNNRAGSCEYFCIVDPRAVQCRGEAADTVRFLSSATREWGENPLKVDPGYTVA
jgi:hypothetical protein